MNDIPIQRYAGSVAAFGAYGAPTLAGLRVSRRTGLLLGLVALVAILYVAGALDGISGLVLLAGPTAAVEKREQALAKLLEAKGLVQSDGTVKAEDEAAFDAHMAEFRTLDAEAGKAEARDGAVGSIAERFAYYTGQATGTPMRFQRTELDPSAPKSLGAQFVESRAYKDLQASGALASENSKFRSDPVVADSRLRFMGAASDVIQTESGGPGAGLITPYYQPGILPLPQRPTIVRQLFANENMPSGDQISYAAQTGFDNAAAAVAQATSATLPANSLKPQSSVAWQRRTADAEWIATWMAATRQAVADENQMRSLIDNQGRLMITIVEDDQLLNGNGTSPNLRGLRNAVGIQTLDLTASDNLDGIRTGRRLVKTGVSRLDPSFIIVNPLDSEEIDLLKDSQGLYRGGNPIGNFGFEQPIWRLQRAETEAMPAGKALVGARAGATVYERQPITVLTADQHADFFVRNLVVILFEERLAFPIYFPTAFVEITFATWL